MIANNSESSMLYSEYQSLSKSLRPIIGEIEKRGESSDSTIELLIECQGILLQLLHLILLCSDLF